jgi:lipid II:glycine glycyltransferase (peptidoglycan interpeptide bridge formation enzyme)
MYYLFGGMDEAYGDSGAKSLLFWKAINMASEKNLTFNFEGSMIPGVERFFRSFGGELTPVYYIYKRKFPFNLIPI